MVPTNIFLIPLPAGFPGSGKAVAEICRQMNGWFVIDSIQTPEGRPRFRLWVRATGAAA